MARKTTIRGSHKHEAYYLDQVNKRMVEAPSVFSSASSATQLVVTRTGKTRRSLTYESAPDVYYTWFNKDYAEAIRLSLRSQAERVAKAKKMTLIAAYHHTLSAYRTCCGNDDRATAMYMMGLAKKYKIGFSTPEDGVTILRGFGKRIAGDELFALDGTKASTVWGYWMAFVMMLAAHRDCEPSMFEGKRLSGEGVLAVLDLFWSVDANVPPCRYFRLSQHAEHQGVTHATVRSLIETFGAERIDDFTQLLIDKKLDEQLAEQLLAEHETVRSLSSEGLIRLIDRHRENKSGEKLSRRAWMMRRELAAFYTDAPTSIVEPKRFPNAQEAFKYTGEKKGTGTSLMVHHNKPCEQDMSHQPGRFQPQIEHRLVIEPIHEVLLRGLRERLKLDGEELVSYADRVLMLFKDSTDPSVTLVALDLYSSMQAEISASLCVKAIKASRAARIPDSLAFDLFHLLGSAVTEECVSLIENDLLGIRECNTLLKNPLAAEVARKHLTVFLTKYRLAQSPSDIVGYARFFTPSSSIS